MDSVSQKLKDLFSLVRVHKWCTQTDNAVADFLKGINKSTRSKQVAYIKKYLTESRISKEEVIVSLALLFKSGTSTLDISTIMYEKLLGRLERTDFQFLMTHLFNKIQPFPPKLTYDITTRVFISFRRAIYAALDIDSVISHFNIETTVFYLVLLIARADLNEQNKAMIYFLLSRIDTDLPMGLYRGVFAYVTTIKTVIDEVLSNPDQVLSSELSLDNEPVPQKKVTDWTPQMTRRKKRKSINITPVTHEKPKPAKEEKPAAAGERKNVEKEKGYSRDGIKMPDKGPKEEEQVFDFSLKGKNSQEYKSPESSTGDEDDTDKEYNDVLASSDKEHNNEEGASTLSKVGNRKRSADKSRDIQDIAEEEMERIEDEEETIQEEDELKEFKITFSRNLDEILAIAESLEGYYPEDDEFEEEDDSPLEQQLPEIEEDTPEDEEIPDEEEPLEIEEPPVLEEDEVKADLPAAEEIPEDTEDAEIIAENTTIGEDVPETDQNTRVEETSVDENGSDNKLEDTREENKNFPVALLGIIPLALIFIVLFLFPPAQTDNNGPILIAADNTTTPTAVIVDTAGTETQTPGVQPTTVETQPTAVIADTAGTETQTPGVQPTTVETQTPGVQPTTVETQPTTVVADTAGTETQTPGVQPTTVETQPTAVIVDTAGTETQIPGVQPTTVETQPTAVVVDTAGTETQTPGVQPTTVEIQPTTVIVDTAGTETQTPGVQPTTVEIIIQDDRFSIIIDGSTIYWIVKEGNTVWELFFYLQENQNVKQIKDFSAVSWLDFMRLISNANPNQDNFNVIWPNQRYSLPK